MELERELEKENAKQAAAKLEGKEIKVENLAEK